MVQVSCTKQGCGWTSADREATLAVLLAAELNNHTAVDHAPPAPAVAGSNNADTGRKAPAIERPKIAAGGTEETWAMFTKKWSMFKAGSKIPDAQLNNQLFQCCVDSLGDDLLRGLTDIATVSEDELLAAIKKLAVQPVAIGVRRTELMNMTQDREEAIRTFHAKVKGRALTCAYKVDCSCDPPSKADYTDCVIKDVLINGLSDEDIKREILGLSDLDKLSVDDTVAKIESKETARNAMSNTTGAAGISSFKKESANKAAEDKKLETLVKCGDCETKIHAFVRIKGGQIRARKYCKDCFQKNHRQQRQNRSGNTPTKNDKKEESDMTPLYTKLVPLLCSNKPSRRPLKSPP